MAAAVAYEIRSAIPSADSVLVDYLAGLIDDANPEEDVLRVTRMILESPAEDNLDALDRLISRLATIVDAKQQASRANGPRNKKLDKILDMSKTGSMSSTIQFTEGVDLESINKSKYAACECTYPALCLSAITEQRVSMSKSSKSRRRSSACVPSSNGLKQVIHPSPGQDREAVAEGPL